jgi:HAD superfamily hydrolase (TIGR01456 family)
MSFGIVCDIDGVLVKGGKPINRSAEALELLLNPEKTDFACPLLFVTNGGDATESSKAESLAHKFSPCIKANHVCMAHSAFKLFTNLAQEKIMLVGRTEETVHQIAHDYGWVNYDTIQNFMKNHPFLVPYQTLNPSELDECLPDLPVHITHDFDSVVILSTPRDWEGSLQVIIDLLLPEHPHEQQSTKLYISCLDLVYSDAYSVPRFSNGAYVRCLESLYEAITGNPLKYETTGKPFRNTYLYAEQYLDKIHKCSRIYAIGDNPIVDVKGANEAGDRWFSILVRTGCFQGENDQTNPAKYACFDLMDAVQFIFQREQQ